MATLMEQILEEVTRANEVRNAEPWYVAHAADQALCSLCGVPDDPHCPHRTVRRVRDGKVRYEHLCNECAQDEYGPMTDDPYED